MGVRSPDLRRAEGFTLIELIVVMSIVAVMMFMAVPAWQSYKKAAALRSQVYNLAALLRYAQMMAVEVGEERQVVVDTAAGTYRLQPLPAGDDGSEVDTVTHWERTMSMPADVTVTVAAAAGEEAPVVQDVYFTPDGAATAVTFQISALVGAYTLSVAGASGAVRVEKAAGEPL